MLCNFFDNVVPCPEITEKQILACIKKQSGKFPTVFYCQAAVQTARKALGSSSVKLLMLTRSVF